MKNYKIIFLFIMMFLFFPCNKCLAATYNIGDYVYFNPFTNEACSQSNYWTPYNTESECYRWAIINVNDDNTLRLMLDHNTHEDIAYTDIPTKINELHWNQDVTILRIGSSKVLSLMRVNNIENAIEAAKNGETILTKQLVGFIWGNYFTYNKDTGKVTQRYSKGYWITPTNSTYALPAGKQYAMTSSGFSVVDENAKTRGLRPTVDNVPTSKVTINRKRNLKNATTVSLVFNGSNFDSLKNDVADYNYSQGITTHNNEYCVYVTRRSVGTNPDYTKGYIFCAKNGVQTVFKEVAYGHGNDFSYNSKVNKYVIGIGTGDNGKRPYKYYLTSDVKNAASGTLLNIKGHWANGYEKDKIGYDYDHDEYYIGDKNFMAPIKADGQSGTDIMMAVNTESTLTDNGIEYHDGYLYTTHWTQGTKENTNKNPDGSDCPFCYNECSRYQVYCDTYPHSTGFIYVFNAKRSTTGKPSKGYGKLITVLYTNFYDLLDSSSLRDINELEAVSFDSDSGNMMYLGTAARYIKATTPTDGSPATYFYPKIYSVDLTDLKDDSGNYFYGTTVNYKDTNSTADVEKYYYGDMLDLDYYDNASKTSYLGWIYSRSGNGADTVADKYISKTSTQLTSKSTSKNGITINLSTVKLESTKYGNNIAGATSISVTDDTIQAFLNNLTCTRCTAVVLRGSAELTTGKFQHGDKLKIKADDANQTVIMTKNLTFNTNYTVVFNSNSGTGTMINQTFTYGTAQRLNTNTYTKAGYTFAGWNTKADGSGTNYTDNQEVNNLTNEVSGTVTLYAMWDKNSSYMKGDINYDGRVTLLDIRIILQKILNNDYNDGEKWIIDYNEDEEASLLDIRAILQYILNNQ